MEGGGSQIGRPGTRQRLPTLDLPAHGLGTSDLGPTSDCSCGAGRGSQISSIDSSVSSVAAGSVSLVPSPELVAAHKSFAWTMISVAAATGAGGLAALAGGSGLFVWNELEVQRIREEKGVPAGGAVEVGSEVLLAQTVRDPGGFALLAVGAALVTTGVVVFFSAPSPGKYDALVEEAWYVQPSTGESLASSNESDNGNQTSNWVCR